MSPKLYSRREWIKNTAGAGIAVTVGPLIGKAESLADKLDNTNVYRNKPFKETHGLAVYEDNLYSNQRLFIVGMKHPMVDGYKNNRPILSVDDVVTQTQTETYRIIEQIESEYGPSLIIPEGRFYGESPSNEFKEGLNKALTDKISKISDIKKADDERLREIFSTKIDEQTYTHAIDLFMATNPQVLVVGAEFKNLYSYQKSLLKMKLDNPLIVNHPAFNKAERYIGDMRSIAMLFNTINNNRIFKAASDLYNIRSGIIIAGVYHIRAIAELLHTGKVELDEIPEFNLPNNNFTMPSTKYGFTIIIPHSLPDEDLKNCSLTITR